MLGTDVQKSALHSNSYQRNLTMYRDEIIAEVWRNRDAYVEEHHHSLEEIGADLQRRQEKHRERLIDRRPNKEMQRTAGSRR